MDRMDKIKSAVLVLGIGYLIFWLNLKPSVDWPVWFNGVVLGVWINNIVEIFIDNKRKQLIEEQAEAISQYKAFIRRWEMGNL